MRMFSLLRMAGRNMAKPHGLGDWAYLIASALISYWLVQAEMGEEGDFGIKVAWMCHKVFAWVEWRAAIWGDRFKAVVDTQLEKRRTV
jgi:hypothetical protein